MVEIRSHKLTNLRGDNMALVISVFIIIATCIVAYVTKKLPLKESLIITLSALFFLVLIKLGYL